MATMLEWRRGQTEPYQLRATTICAVISLSLVVVVAGSILIIDGDMPILAYTCFTFGGSVLVLCAVLVTASLKVKRKESSPADSCDPPPPYKAAWRRDFYASRMTVEHQPASLHPSGYTEQDAINFCGLSVRLSSSVPTPPSPSLSSPTINPATSTTVSPTSNATANTTTAVTCQ
ncbi:uncharacterized protein [Procambarus clarkii]|uniref:uncharacterized protein n=1 Tax=Procambarus clarkii TaxID=6728 RepID=UPI0037445F5F